MTVLFPVFPRDEIKEIQEELGYEDNLVVVGEYFHLWVIEAPEWVQDEFPAEKAGLEVKFVKDMKRFREQKVQVLNGCHTGSYAVSYLSGIETVRDAYENLEVGSFMKELVLRRGAAGAGWNRKGTEEICQQNFRAFCESVYSSPMAKYCLKCHVEMGKPVTCLH